MTSPFVTPPYHVFIAASIFDGDGTLMVSDLGSANQTLVNDRAIMEMRLNINDRILIGDTTLLVLNNGKESTGAQKTVVAPVAAPSPDAAASGTNTPMFDLGLNPESKGAASEKGSDAPFNRKPLYFLLGLAVVAVIGVFSIRALLGPGPDDNVPPPRQDPKPAEGAFYPLEIRYEKIQADDQNVFRYYVIINRDDTITAEIDNLKDDRHITERDKPVASNVLEKLARSLKSTGFFDLDPDYRGHTPDVHETWDLSITIGNDYHRSLVVNTLEPDEFKAARELFEEFCENELGLIALSKTPEELIELASEAHLLAKKLYDGRDVAPNNLADCMTACNEVKWYLQTIDPKPDFYDEMLVLLDRATNELDSRFRDKMFMATRSMTAKDWREAADHLNELVQMLHESDERMPDVRTKLTIVNNNLDIR